MYIYRVRRVFDFISAETALISHIPVIRMAVANQPFRILKKRRKRSFSKEQSSLSLPGSGRVISEFWDFLAEGMNNEAWRRGGASYGMIRQSRLPIDRKLSGRERLDTQHTPCNLPRSELKKSFHASCNRLLNEIWKESLFKRSCFEYLSSLN